MITIIHKFSVGAGTNIEDAVREVLDYIKHRNNGQDMAEFEFNGVELTVYSWSTVEDTCTDYRIAANEGSKPIVTDIDLSGYDKNLKNQERMRVCAELAQKVSNRDFCAGSRGRYELFMKLSEEQCQTK